jgi:hypothetical protein
MAGESLRAFAHRGADARHHAKQQGMIHKGVAQAHRSRRIFLRQEANDLGLDPDWPAPRRLLCGPCPDVLANILGRQRGLGFQRTQSFVDGRQHFRGFLGNEAGIKPVRHLPQLLRGEFLQSGLDFGYGAHDGLSCDFRHGWQVREPGASPL